LPADDYTASRRTGSFLVIDPADGGTLAAGLVGAPMPVMDGESSEEPAQDLVSPGP
jgi:sulfate adenylyltransferase subunit 1